MQSVIILGTGRSGTSLAAGLFRNTGLYFGDDPVGKSVSNPTGYFEDHEINGINNEIIEALMRWPVLEHRVRRRLDAAAHTDPRALWMAAPRRLKWSAMSDDINRRLGELCQRGPFCYKDPRFSVTLPTWLAHLPGGTRFLVVFRDPTKTVDSMLRDAHEMYDPPLAIDETWGFTSWHRTYQRLLTEFAEPSSWLFVHYDQIISGEAIPAIESLTGHTLDTSLIDPSISRSKAKPLPRIGKPCASVYERLCERSKHDVAARSHKAGMSAAV